MGKIRAIAFDLFDTLVWIDKAPAPNQRPSFLVKTLAAEGFAVDAATFPDLYRQTMARHIEATRDHGRETHNRFWLADALSAAGIPITPEDPRIARVVEAHFALFENRIHPVPGVREMLAQLAKRYRLGLLSNFTHGPAARRVLDKFGLSPFFEVIVISGEIGFRKPHPSAFAPLVEKLGCDCAEIAFVGDNLLDDVSGARQCGLQPVWTSIVLQMNGAFSERWFDSGPERPERDVPEIRAWPDLMTWLERGS